MRFLRFLVLIAAILAVYAAQYLFDKASLEFLRSAWFSENIPFLWDFAQWSGPDQQTFGLYLAGIGALLFGLAVYGWPQATNDDSTPSSVSAPRISVAALLLTVAAVLAALFLVLHLQQNADEPEWSHYLWVAAMGVYALGCWLADRKAGANVNAPTPERSWPTFLLILAVGGLLLGWQLTTVPVRVDGVEASHGLQALQIAAGWESRIFASEGANTPLFAFYPAALGITFSGDWLLGNRLAGLYAGLLTILGVWLLGCELFRRTPTADGDADDGRSPALLAAAFTAVGYTFVHFGRIPHYLEPVAWGVLGLWALHRGVRTGSLIALGLGGLLLGLTATLSSGGILFVGIALLWWIFWLLARRGWLGQTGWGGFAAWAGGIFVFLAPFAGVWLRIPATFLARLQETSIFNPGALAQMEGVYGVQGLNAVLLENARRTLLTFWIFGEKSTLFGLQSSSPMLDSLIAPILLLGIGYLLLNLDRTQSWMLAGWLAGALVLGGVLLSDPPHWPRLLPVLPVAGLLCALAVDRARTTLMQIVGLWMGQFSLFVVIGLLVLAGSYNWVEWYEVQTVQADAESYAGRAIHSLSAERTAILIDTGDGGRAQWSDPIVYFLAGGPYAKQGITISPDNWPVNLPPQSSVILQPNDQALAAELQSRFPGGLFL
ncbi:MAG: hypothetical protein DWI57_11465, partial [Chloroflexi bacterium]